MTPRERILAAFRHQVPDRTPSDGWFHNETMARLKKYFGTDSEETVLQELGVEGWGHVGMRLVAPKFEERCERRSFKGMTRRGIWQDERTYSDAWGTVTRIGESGWYEEWFGGPLTDLDGEDPAALEGIPLLTTDNLMLPEDCATMEQYQAKIASMKARDLIVNGNVPNPYKKAWELRGMDNVLADYLINREFLEALYDKLYTLYTAMAVRMVEGGADMISMIGDFAMQDRIIMGPDTWREVDKPRMAKFVEACRRANPEVFMFIHSDGKVTEVMDDLIEIGFDIINPIQPECMNPVEVKRRWGDKITIHGGISLQCALLHGTPREAAKEVENLIHHCGYNGGLVMFPSNVVQPDSPTENVVACFHAARDIAL